MAGKRVLVVEDNDLNYALVEFVMRQDGWDVFRAATGLEALELATRELPNLIFMDVHLPGMDGLEVTRRLRREPATSRIPIVALTASAMPRDRQRVVEAGCDDFLSKPVSPADLLACAKRFLGAPCS